MKAEFKKNQVWNSNEHTPQLGGGNLNSDAFGPGVWECRKNGFFLRESWMGDPISETENKIARE